MCDGVALNNFWRAKFKCHAVVFCKTCRFSGRLGTVQSIVFFVCVCVDLYKTKAISVRLLKILSEKKFVLLYNCHLDKNP